MVPPTSTSMPLLRPPPVASVEPWPMREIVPVWASITPALPTYTPMLYCSLPWLTPWMLMAPVPVARTNPWTATAYWYSAPVPD